MVALSRQEINLRRLLAKCELTLKQRKEDPYLEKYVETLEDMLQEIKKHADVSIESLRTYQSRIIKIKSAAGITTSKYTELSNPLAEREDLLGLRQRHNVTKEGSAVDLDQVIKYNEGVQDKITEEMLNFAKTLKDQSELANKIIKKDKEIVSTATQLTEQNFSKLEVESTKLAEHSKRAWKCWMWIMLGLVFFIFINMVLFMKIMKKSK